MKLSLIIILILIPLSIVESTLSIKTWKLNSSLLENEKEIEQS